MRLPSVVATIVTLVVLGAMVSAPAEGRSGGGAEDDAPPPILSRGWGDGARQGGHGPWCGTSACVDRAAVVLPRRAARPALAEPSRGDGPLVGGLPRLALPRSRSQTVGSGDAPDGTGRSAPSPVSAAGRDRSPGPLDLPLSAAPRQDVPDLSPDLAPVGEVRRGIELRQPAAEASAIATPVGRERREPREPRPEALRKPTPDLRPIPSAPAPAGLGGVDLPADAAGIADLFARLPLDLGGKPRRPNPIDVGEGFGVEGFGTAYGASGADHSPDWIRTGLVASEIGAPLHFTAGLVVVEQALADREPPSPGETAVFGTSALGRDGGLIWARGFFRLDLIDPQFPVLYTAEWGNLDSRWRFGAVGETPEEVDLLLAAVATAGAAQAAGEPAPPMLPAASSASSSRPRAGPSPEECRIAPRPAEEVRQVVGELRSGRSAVAPTAPPPTVALVEVAGERPAGTASVGVAQGPQERPPATPPSFVPPPGDVADTATVAGVTATFRERIACVNANDVARAAALDTDVQFRRTVEGMLNRLPPGTVRAMLTRRPPDGSAAAPEEQLSAPALREVRLLDDGRVGVVALVIESNASGTIQRLVYVEFARVGDRWLFDGDEVTIEERVAGREVG